LTVGTSTQGPSFVNFPQYDRPYLQFTSTTSSGKDQKSYSLKLKANDEKYTGTYTFTLWIGLANYPNATPSQSTFTVTIEGCIVTSLKPNDDIALSYSIGDGRI